MVFDYIKNLFKSIFDYFTRAKTLKAAISVILASVFTFLPLCKVTYYGGYSRQRLISDDMESLCTPVVSGDFIQSWYCYDWDLERWEQHMEMLTSAGIDLLILQNCADTYSGDDETLKGLYDCFYYPSAMADDTTISTADCTIYPDMVENCLKAAEKYGVKILIGLGGNSEWWNRAFTDKAWCDREAAFICAEANELYGLYKTEYSDAFYGWYWYHEMYSSILGRYEVNWSDMINICLEELTELDSSMPMLFSPFISSYESGSPGRILECWTYLMENTSFRKGDIFCPQDGFGTRDDMSLLKVEQIALAIKEACSHNDNVSLWFNVENFNNDFTSADIGRYADQMNICSKFAEKLITFSFSHYYSPLDGQEEYYNDYLEYLDFVYRVK